MAWCHGVEPHLECDGSADKAKNHSEPSFVFCPSEFQTKKVHMERNKICKSESDLGAVRITNKVLHVVFSHRQAEVYSRHQRRVSGVEGSPLDLLKSWHLLSQWAAHRVLWNMWKCQNYGNGMAMEMPKLRGFVISLEFLNFKFFYDKVFQVRIFFLSD